MFAVIVRIFVIPRFKMVPGKFQMLLEQAVDLFDGMAKSNSPGRSGFLGAYIFTAGAYIFIGTLFELFGIQAITTEGSPITLPGAAVRCQRRHRHGLLLVPRHSGRRYRV